MNTDIRICVSFRGHRKRKKLMSILGPGSTDYLIDLWIGTALNRPEGILDGYDEADIAFEAGWEGDPDEFVAALIKVGFLKKSESGVYRLHDWAEHNPYAADAKERSARAKRAVSIRWEREQAKDRSDTERIRPVYDPNTGRNTDSNTPEPEPNPKPKDKRESKDSLVPESGNDEKTEPSKCPHGQIIDLYHEILPEHPRVDKDDWGEDRQKVLRTRWREKTERQSLEWWRGFFEKVRGSPWLMGDNDKGWLPNLDWLLKLSNFRKVNEGYYQARASPMKAKYGEKAIQSMKNTAGWEPGDKPDERRPKIP